MGRRPRSARPLGPELRAGAEILLVGRYIADVHTSPEASLVPALDDWLTQVRGSLTPTSSAIRAYMRYVTLSRLIEAHRRSAADWDPTGTPAQASLVTELAAGVDLGQSHARHPPIATL